MQLPGNTRQLVRDALRAAPGFASFVAGVGGPDAKINTLTKDQLIEAAGLMGINVRAIVRGALGDTSHVPFVPAPPAPVSLTLLEPSLNLTEPSLDLDPALPVGSVAAVQLRRELATAMVEGDFAALDRTLEGLLAEASKPPVVQIVHVPAPVALVRDEAGLLRPVPLGVPAVRHVSTAAALFGLKDDHGRKQVGVFDAGAMTPAVDARYSWPADVTHAALCSLARGRNVWLYGPAGTGKSTFVEQLAARTGRPFFLIPCDDTTEAPELVGMTVPHQGGVRWQDGALTAAMRVPLAIILIDEPTVARAGAVMVLQSVLASGVLAIKETGEAVRCAEGVRFIVADNTNGTGGGSAEGYEGTRRLNRATLDRFSATLRLDYLPPKDEAAALVAHTKCAPALADLLVECAGLTRKARVTHALGLRRLIAWAEALTDGVSARYAFESAILNSCARDDREPTEQACSLGLDSGRVKLALANDTPVPVSAPSPDGAGRQSGAAADFT